MTTINFTQTCKENDIHEFSRTRGGWMKLVEGYDKSKYGGYRFIGSNFIKVGNFDTEINKGLYIDCSKHYNKEDDEVREIMNLFKISENGNITLIKSLPKSRNWSDKLEKYVHNYFQNEELNAQEIVSKLKNETHNQETLKQVANLLQEEFTNKVWLNESHFSAYMQEAHVYRANYDLNRSKVQKKAVELFNNSYEAQKYFNYEINNDHHVRLLYSFITECTPYSDFKITFEKISEDYYKDLQHIEELKKYNYNETFRQGAIHDVGHYVTFNGKYANTKTVYLIIPNVPSSTIKIQKLELTI